MIRENSTIKREEIAHIIGKSLRTVKTRMIEMQEKGLITRKNRKKKWRMGNFITYDIILGATINHFVSRQSHFVCINLN